MKIGELDSDTIEYIDQKGLDQLLEIFKANNKKVEISNPSKYKIHTNIIDANA